jgi:hypothetical protein
MKCNYRVRIRVWHTRRPATQEKVLNDIVPQPVCISKHAKAKRPKRRREKCEPVGVAKAK